MRVLGAAGIPCGEIKSVGEVCTAAQLIERGMVRQVRHHAAGDLSYVAGPIRFDDRPPPDAVPPPRLGEHTTQVLAEWLGMSAGEVRDFAAAGAFGPAAMAFERT